MGFELTGVPKHYSERAEQNYWDEYWYNGRRPRNRISHGQMMEDLGQQIAFDLRNTKCHEIHEDLHCMEVSSPILYTMEEAKKWSIKVRKVLLANNCPPKHPNVICGGGHIHVGIHNLNLRIEMYRHLITKWCLPWIFGEPDDTESMCNLIQLKDVVFQKLLDDRIHPNWPYFNTENKMLLYLLIRQNTNKVKDRRFQEESEMDKKHMVRITKNTLEMRFFEMAKTWEEQKLQIEFVDAYCRWASNELIEFPTQKIHMMNEYEFQNLKAKDAINQFAGLCSLIGIDPKPYQVFIRRNLYPRWKEGRIRV